MSLLFSLLIAGFTGLVAGYVGSLMVSKRMALAGGALGHLALPGITIALIFGFDVSIGAFLFLVLGILLIWLFELRTNLPLEALTAVVFASSVAIAFLFLGEEQLVPALIGDVSQINFYSLMIISFISFIVLLIINKIYSKVILINISDGLAKSIGFNIKKLNLIFLFCVAVTVALSVRVVGGLMTAAIIAIPAIASRLLAHNLRSYSYLSAVFGGVSCVIGVLLANSTGLPAGPSIIIFNSLFFLFSVVFKR